MKLKITAIFYLAATFAIFFNLQSVNVFAQQNKTKRSKQTVAKKPKVIVLKATRAAIERNGKDANIKTDDAPNERGERARRPIGKGGERERRGGGDCKIIFGNDTDFRVKLYVGGIYRGTAAAFNDAYLYIAPVAEIVVYARADFTDGTFLVWGPEKYECGANQFVYFKLTGGKN